MTGKRVLGILLAGSLMAGCATVQLISNYDQKTDEAATQLQKDIAGFSQKLISAQRDEDRWFSTHQDFYEKAAVDIDALQVRAGSIYKNSITLEQLQSVEENLAYMALLHKGCVSAPLNNDQRAKVRELGVDTSLECRTAYGANMNDADRGKSMLSPALVRPTKAILDTQLQAVIALEDAKKRGKKEDGK